jgi:hypothetical protein
MEGLEAIVTRHVPQRRPLCRRASGLPERYVYDTPHTIVGGVANIRTAIVGWRGDGGVCQNPQNRSRNSPRSQPNEPLAADLRERHVLAGQRGRGRVAVDLDALGFPRRNRQIVLRLVALRIAKSIEAPVCDRETSRSRVKVSSAAWTAPAFYREHAKRC